MKKMLSGNQYVYKKIVFQISAVRTGVCAFMDATLLTLKDLSSFFETSTFTLRSEGGKI